LPPPLLGGRASWPTPTTASRSRRRLSSVSTSALAVVTSPIPTPSQTTGPELRRLAHPLGGTSDARASLDFPADGHTPAVPCRAVPCRAVPCRAVPYPSRPQRRPLPEFAGSARSGTVPSAALHARLAAYVLEAYAEGRSLREIAELVDRSQTAVRRAQDKHGVRLRSSGAAPLT
jgi:hypothetical protein